MDLKETIISSLFSHMILFLFALALSNYAGGFKGNFNNIVSVTLPADNSEGLHEEKTDPRGELPSLPKPQPNEETGMPDQAAKDFPQEPQKTPEPDSKPATDAGAAKTANPENFPTRGEGNDKMDGYYQFIMLHKKVFTQKAGIRLNRLIGEALKANTRSFYGGVATVSLKFGSEGELIGVVVDSDSLNLKAFLEEVGWYDIPSPAAYLGHTVQIHFAVLEGYLSSNIDIL